jgi:hypothetical protein
MNTYKNKDVKGYKVGASVFKSAENAEKARASRAKFDATIADAMKDGATKAGAFAAFFAKRED